MTAQAAPKQAASDAVRVAVLPFQINGGADLNYLNDELPKLFEQRLAQKGFKVIPAKDTLRLLKNQQISQLNLATARSIARQPGRTTPCTALQQDRRRVQHRRPHGGCRWTAGGAAFRPGSRT